MTDRSRDIRLVSSPPGSLTTLFERLRSWKNIAEDYTLGTAISLYLMARARRAASKGVEPLQHPDAPPPHRGGHISNSAPASMKIINRNSFDYDQRSFFGRYHGITRRQTCLVLRSPIPLHHTSRARSLDAAGAMPRRSLRGLITLVVDDERLVGLTVGHYLEQMGLRVLHASDESSALALARQHPGFALLLTDVLLPGTTGRALSRQVLAQSPGTAILYMSALPKAELVAQGYMRAGDECITKPFAADELERRVRRLILQG